MKIEKATPADTAQLVRLVNSGYRGDESRKGWTTEADLLEGIRTDESSMLAMIRKEHVVILKAIDDMDEMVGCVYLELQHKSLYLGMLTVSPTLQGAGIGKYLLSAAEKLAEEFQCERIIMTVISERTELIDWYKRRGYRDTGVRKPFPMTDPKFGLPRKFLEFIEMEKRIA